MALQRSPWALLGALVLSSHILGTVAQFPKLCATNATTEDGVCCPTPPGHVFPCGGPGRGRCNKIPENIEDFSPVLPGYENDDRLNWPHHFFHYACECEGNYFGYMCHECAFGFRGENCDVRHMAVRKDATKLTKEEQDRFRRVVDHSKTAMSDYVVLSNPLEQDPCTKPTFTEVSVYDFFVFIHQYSARHTVLRNADRSPTMECPIQFDALAPYDFGHKGPAFPTFHRALNLLWERELQKASGEEDFTFPYWDWRDMGNDCNVCVNELVGATNHSDPSGRLESGSPFSDWTILCQMPNQDAPCYMCEPAGYRAPFTRALRPGISLPEKRQVDYALSLKDYDLPPYNHTAPKESFRNVLIGSADENGVISETGRFTLHAQGHQFFIGPMSAVPLSLNDPLFILHHTYVDKILEEWFRKYKPDASELPERGSPAGHNRNTFMVPFFPVLKNVDYFGDSRRLGYDYDDMVERVQRASLGQSVEADDGNVLQGSGGESTSSPGRMSAIVLGAVSLVGLLVIVIAIVRRKKRASDDLDENAPLLQSLE